MLVSVDNNSGWPEALLLTNPTTERVLEFLAEYIAQHGIPQRIRTDPGTAFKSEKIIQFCRDNFIKHIVCPMKDHWGNGKVERMIGTFNERLRVDNRVVLERKNKKLVKNPFRAKNRDWKKGKSAFERHKKQKSNTPKTATVNDFISERDPKLQINEEDFSPDVDSTVLIRERTRGSKLDGTFTKRKAKIVAESKHTITILPNKGKMVTLYKRDVALKRLKAEKEPVRERNSSEEELPHCSKKPVEPKPVRKKITARVASTSTEEEINKSGGEAIHEKEEKIQEPISDQTLETEETTGNPEQTIEGTEAEEGDVTETTPSEYETIGYGQSEEEGEVNEKWPIRGEASFETSKKKTRSGRLIKRPEWLGQNVMISAVDKEKPEEEAKTEKTTTL